MYSVLHFQTPKKCRPYTYHNTDVLQYEQIDLAEKTTNILAIVGPKGLPIAVPSIRQLSVARDTRLDDHASFDS